MLCYHYCPDSQTPRIGYPVHSCFIDSLHASRLNKGPGSRCHHAMPSGHEIMKWTRFYPKLIQQTGVTPLDVAAFGES